MTNMKKNQVIKVMQSASLVLVVLLGLAVLIAINKGIRDSWF